MQFYELLEHLVNTGREAKAVALAEQVHNRFYGALSDTDLLLMDVDKITQVIQTVNSLLTQTNPPTSSVSTSFEAYVQNLQAQGYFVTVRQH